MRGFAVAVLVLGMHAFIGCSGPKDFQPIDPDKVLFWDRQTTETGDLLRSIIQEFNDRIAETTYAHDADGNGALDSPHPKLPIEAQYSGGYSEINRKVSASIQARTVPAMAVGYQSMTVEYVLAGAVIELDPFIADPEVGLSNEELDDFFPAFLETNRYPDFGNKLYSFPFCKSVLMMYFNRSVLEEAGIDAPPSTWDAFLDQCRQIKAKTGKYAYAANIDASTVDGMIFSMGGDVVQGRTTLFDSPPALEVFRLIETLANEQLAYHIPTESYDDRDAFAQDRIAFFFRSSSHRAYIGRMMEDSRTRWGLTRIPQKDPRNPRTVLYGPNVSVFKTTPEQQRRAWEFIRYFTSRDVTVRWALGTGYLPVRKSAADHPDMKAFWQEWEYNRAAFDCLPFAVSEPNLGGWQEVRDLIEKAETAVFTGKQSDEEAARQLKKNADAVLAEFGG